MQGYLARKKVHPPLSLSSCSFYMHVHTLQQVDSAARFITLQACHTYPFSGQQPAAITHSGTPLIIKRLLRRALGMGLLEGPRRRMFLTSEVPLYL